MTCSRREQLLECHQNATCGGLLSCLDKLALGTRSRLDQGLLSIAICCFLLARREYISLDDRVKVGSLPTQMRLTASGSRALLLWPLISQKTQS